MHAPVNSSPGNVQANRWAQTVSCERSEILRSLQEPHLPVPVGYRGMTRNMRHRNLMNLWKIASPTATNSEQPIDQRAGAPGRQGRDAASHRKSRKTWIHNVSGMMKVATGVAIA